jgi:branched-chain amino acid transport system permease protein
MSTFLQFLFGGLVSGAIFALIALGWVLIYNVSGVLNLAQGEFVMIGALVFVELRGTYELPVLVSIAGAVAAAVAVAVVLDIVILRRLRNDQMVPMVLVTVGASVVLREIAQEIFGKDPLRTKPLLDGDPLSIGGATVLPHTLLLWATVVVLVLLLTLFFARSLVGKAMRACHENALGAQVVGVSPQRMRTAAFALSAALGAIAGVLIVPVTSMSWNGGTALGLKGFVAATFGGLGSLPGAVVGGIAIGIIEALAAGYVSSAYKDVFATLVLLALLLARPQGLLGASQRDERVGGGLVPRLSAAMRTRTGGRGRSAAQQGAVTDGEPPTRENP